MQTAGTLFAKGVPPKLVGPLMGIQLPAFQLDLRPGSTYQAENDEKWGNSKMGQVLVYFDRAHAQDALDTRLGAHNWQSYYETVSCTETRDQETRVIRRHAVVKCTITIRLDNGLTVSKEDYGEAEIKYDPVPATKWDYKTRTTIADPLKQFDHKVSGMTDAVKAAASDAFRRACAAHGLGRIYYLKSKSIYHPLNDKGFFYFGKWGATNYGNKEDLLKQFGYTAAPAEVETAVNTILTQYAEEPK